MKHRAINLFARAFLLVVAALPLRAAEVTVFAAASLSDALKEIAANYEKQSGDKIIFNFGASSTLARQIEAGAPADLFFSADEAQMDRLAKRIQRMGPRSKHSEGETPNKRHSHRRITSEQ